MTTCAFAGGMPYLIHRERSHNLNATMTLIETTNNGTFFTLTTEKGNTVEVSTSLGHVMVFIQRKGLKQLAKGRRFSSVAAAAEAYKAADVKAALYALAEA